MDISVLCCGHFYPLLSPTPAKARAECAYKKMQKIYPCDTCMEVKSEDAKHSITAPEVKAEYRYKKDAENINGI